MSANVAISVAEATARILADLPTVPPVEMIPLAKALGRTLARDVAAKRTQPPAAVSAMDGYAVRAADLASLPARLRQIGESAAGHGFWGSLALGRPCGSSPALRFRTAPTRS